MNNWREEDIKAAHWGKPDCRLTKCHKTKVWGSWKRKKRKKVNAWAGPRCVVAEFVSLSGCDAWILLSLFCFSHFNVDILQRHLCKHKLKEVLWLLRLILNASSLTVPTENLVTFTANCWDGLWLSLHNTHCFGWQILNVWEFYLRFILSFLF